MSSGKPYKIRSLKYDIRDGKIREYKRQDSAGTYLTEGMYFDVNRLDAERQRITDNLLRNGYYKFNKEYNFLYGRYGEEYLPGGCNHASGAFSAAQ